MIKAKTNVPFYIYLIIYQNEYTKVMKIQKKTCLPKTTYQKWHEKMFVFIFNCVRLMVSNSFSNFNCNFRTETWNWAEHKGTKAQRHKGTKAQKQKHKGFGRIFLRVVPTQTLVKRNDKSRIAEEFWQWSIKIPKLEHILKEKSAVQVNFLLSFS